MENRDHVIAFDSIVEEELHSNQGNWKGGYFEGNPLDPMAPSTYGLAGYLSILHLTHLIALKPYITSESAVLEIGPGRGAWTKCIVSLGAREVWCLDALSAEHNGFWDYVGRHESIRYHKVQDCSISMVPDNHIDHFFTFGCFMHISPPLITEYMKNLYPKMKKGAHGYALFGDYDKRNALIDDQERYSLMRILNGRAFLGRRYGPIRAACRMLLSAIPPRFGEKLDKSEDQAPRADRWYHFGLGPACEMLESFGFEILERDVGIIPRDPLVHFWKP